MPNLSPVALIIIALNLLVSYKGFEDRYFFDKYKFNIGSIRRGEQLRMLSSGFLHVDPKHLLFNMVTLYFFSDRVVIFLGVYGFLLVYFASLILGSLLSFFLNKENYMYSAVGASGAVTGVIYSAILIDPWMRINAIIPGFIFGIGYLFYSIYGMKKRSDSIGHDAHFGGAIGGYAVTLFLLPVLFEIQPVMVGLLALPIIILFVMIKMKRI